MEELCPILPVGPLVPPSLLGEDQNLGVGIDMWKPEESCMEWLNHQTPSSVIYISFGSLIMLSDQQFESIATALKNNNHPFLWVVKGSEIRRTSDGTGGLPSEFLEETKDQGIVVPWSPQTKVLAHPAVACFLTHCGWNSMLEAVASGLPMIAYPQWTDQPTNAKLIADVLKVGVRLRPESSGVITAEEVEKCIKEVMVGARSEEFKNNAVEFKRTARLASAEGGSSDRNIQVLVDEIISSCSTGV
jgi:UDP-glucose:(indol-3-yl)acetate beta-D-glucosyltransferase